MNIRPRTLSSIEEELLIDLENEAKEDLKQALIKTMDAVEELIKAFQEHE